MAQFYLVAADTDADLGAIGFAKAPRGLRVTVATLNLDKLIAQILSPERADRRDAARELLDTATKSFRMIKGYEGDGDGDESAL